MADRLEIFAKTGSVDITAQAYSALKEITGKDPSASPRTQGPMRQCCMLLANAGAKAVLVQRQVQDPDFLAEYSAYYSRQFSSTEKFCTRLHFFSGAPQQGEGVLAYLDRVEPDTYLGFMTLRPVIKSPIGASIISSHLVSGFIRSTDRFPVHIGGKQYWVSGTPFMQQDNAVGACAQASIWMALRTLRKREGDRAHDPAQITDAATKYYVNGRIRPNRDGLTHHQMVEAIRAAGYSPHSIPLGDLWHMKGATEMNGSQIQESLMSIHPYIESEIPIVLILFPPSGGHAVVVIGHTWDANMAKQRVVQVTCPNGLNIEFTHAASWVPELLIHNDNAGPYRHLKEVDPQDYSLQHGAVAIPLLPADVFMSAEEAAALALEVVSDIFGGLNASGMKSAQAVQQLASGLTVRLSLVEKRKLRNWAATEALVPELKEKVRLMEMPKRVWVFELHQRQNYGAHGAAGTNTLVGLILIDSTGDNLGSSVLLLHLNFPALIGLPHGVLLTWNAKTGIPSQATQTNDAGATRPIRH
jgi:hypothetical protein